MIRLYLMAGAPGSGKSTYVTNAMKQIPASALHVSRDAIRFSLVSEEEYYFAHEDEVFDKFCEEIQAGLDAGLVVFADATHLTEKARNRTLNKLNLKGIDIGVISFELPLEICLERNAKREGTRAYVPESALRRMYNSYQPPHFNEKYKYLEIGRIVLNGEGEAC